jgi:hypothetical protein
MPTAESALAELAATIAERAIIPTSEALDILESHLGTENAWPMLEAALDEPCWSAEFTTISDHLLHLPTLADGRVFTHRLTDAEVTADEIDLTRDAPPLVRALTVGFLGVLAAQPIATADAGPPRRLDLPAEPDEVQVLRLPPGSLAGAGLVPGTLLALRVTFVPGRLPTTRPGRLPTTEPGHLPTTEPEPIRSMSPAALLPNSEAVRLTIDVLSDEPTGTDFADAFTAERGKVEDWVEIEDMIMRTLLHHPDLLRQPSQPISESLASVGVDEDVLFLCPLDEDITSKLREMRVNDFAQTYRLSKPQATALTDAIIWLIAREKASGGVDADAAGVPESDLLEAINTALGDPRWTIVLADEALRDPATPHALAALAQVPATGGQSRASRGHRRYLAGRAAEALGRPLEAAAHYRAANQLVDIPDALLHLAGIECDRGDFTAAGALLDRAQANPSHPLNRRVRDVLAYRKATTPQRTLGRNERCWCRSGLKSKMCHGRPGTTGPLAERARSLNARLVWFLTDSAHSIVARLLDVASEAAGDVELPDDELGQWLIDVIAVEGGAMRRFREMRGELLPADERELLDSWLTTSRALYEVTDAAAGEWFELRHVVTGEVTRVIDDFRAPRLGRGDLVCARVAPMAGSTEGFAMVKVQPGERDTWLRMLANDPNPAQLAQLWASGYAEPIELTVEGHPREVWIGLLTTDDPAALASQLDTLFADHGDNSWDFSERVTAPSGLAVWTEPVTLDLIDNDLTVVARSEQRYEITLAKLDGLPAELNEIAFYPSDAPTFVHPIRGAYEDEEEWPFDLDDEGLDDEGLGDEG